MQDVVVFLRGIYRKGWGVFRMLFLVLVKEDDFFVVKDGIIRGNYKNKMSIREFILI